MMLAFLTLPTRWHKHQSAASDVGFSAALADQNKNSILTVIPQKAAVFFPNLCRNHCHNGMLITAETWVNMCKQKICDAQGKRSIWNVVQVRKEC